MTQLYLSYEGSLTAGFTFRGPFVDEPYQAILIDDVPGNDQEGDVVVLYRESYRAGEPLKACGPFADFDAADVFIDELLRWEHYEILQVTR